MNEGVSKQDLKGNGRLRKPLWLRTPIRVGKNLDDVKKILSRLHLNTVCTAANCPNRMECYGNRTATFLILGDVCTRGCTFCDVPGGKPLPPDQMEPDHLAQAAKELNLAYVVVTSVTRDDLPDGGADYFARVCTLLRQVEGVQAVELLVPDFQGSQEALNRVLESGPDVLNHNIETVPRLYGDVRPGADYRRSLELLSRAAAWSRLETGGSLKTKSGIMLGLGERDDEVVQVLQDLRESACDFLTIGQYLPPSKESYPLERYVSPEEFDRWKEKALALGFSQVASGPLVRSSYHAAEMAG